VTLDCASSGFPKPTVTWGYINTNLKHGGRYKMESIGKLTIIETRGTDGGFYHCIVNSRAGGNSRTIKLVVKGIYFVRLFSLSVCLLLKVKFVA